jgi:hypothetical protein
MKASEILLVINYEAFHLIPAKIYDYWAVGGPPILLLSCPGAAAVRQQHGLGLTVEPSDVEDTASHLTIYNQETRTRRCT